MSAPYLQTLVLLPSVRALMSLYHGWRNQLQMLIGKMRMLTEVLQPSVRLLAPFECTLHSAVSVGCSCVPRPRLALPRSLFHVIYLDSPPCRAEVESVAHPELVRPLLPRSKSRSLGASRGESEERSSPLRLHWSSANLYS